MLLPSPSPLWRHRDSGLESEIRSPDSWSFPLPDHAVLLARPPGRRVREGIQKPVRSWICPELSQVTLAGRLSLRLSLGQVHPCLLGSCAVYHLVTLATVWFSVISLKAQ